MRRGPNSSAHTPCRLQRQQPPRRPPVLRDPRPPRPAAPLLAQPILRNCGLRPPPRPPPWARPSPSPRPPRTRPGRAPCLRGCCSPRRPRRACPVSGLASPGSALPPEAGADQRRPPCPSSRHCLRRAAVLSGCKPAGPVLSLSSLLAHPAGGSALPRTALTELRASLAAGQASGRGAGLLVLRS